MSISGFTIEIEPRLFSFNSPTGACSNCDGLGYREKFDPELIIGDPNLSLIEGVILPWNKNNQFYKDLVLGVSNIANIDPRKPWNEIDNEKKNNFYGDSKNIFLQTLTMDGLMMKIF